MFYLATLLYSSIDANKRLYMYFAFFHLMLAIKGNLYFGQFE